MSCIEHSRFLKKRNYQTTYIYTHSGPHPTNNEVKKPRILNFCPELVHVIFVVMDSSYLHQQLYFNTKNSDCRCAAGLYTETSTFFDKLYINDLPDCLNNCKSILHADDTLLYYSAKSANDLQATINDDLQSLSHWLNNNVTFSL